MKAEDAVPLEKINLLVQEGEKFNFQREYDSSALLHWIEATSQFLCGFRCEQRESLLYCLASRAMPAQRVGHVLWILKNCGIGFKDLSTDDFAPGHLYLIPKNLVSGEAGSHIGPNLKFLANNFGKGPARPPGAL
jgi:hypothetical protein